MPNDKKQQKTECLSWLIVLPKPKWGRFVFKVKGCFCLADVLHGGRPFPCADWIFKDALKVLCFMFGI